ncbi:GNAT family N-acetyltransferase [Flavobacterium silvaticum]|uniref:GNAT family N-acetyltransferase n=1 Tax=Flavobacterium silvaticum TaxID=1852020 RepID=A0A972FPJ9_9FLAO|nr:GNAT family N-acetyltransferase [Flavobacterium silvaticum]NMH27064.1 GNAT family N-acetyltransferase [Flavobacterium silvaticum]
MQIRQAAKSDIDSIMMVLDEARNIMRQNGNLMQWNNGYPSREVILEDIELKQAFVCIADSEIAGYSCFIYGDDPDPYYKVIENGSWLNNKPYGVIHRLATNGNVKGIAQSAFDFAFSVTDNIRVDTHHENIPMQNFLKKSGFSYCGIIYVADGTPRDAFQKDISKE